MTDDLVKWLREYVPACDDPNDYTDDERKLLAAADRLKVLERDNESMIERLEYAGGRIEALEKAHERQIAYSSDLQRIIEDLCSGRPIRVPETSARFHFDMAVAHAIRALIDLPLPQQHGSTAKTQTDE